MDFSASNRICSFCGKQGERRKMAGGLGAMMCLECLEYYHSIATSKKKVATMSRPPWESMSDAELLSHLPLILKSAEQNMSFAREWVDLIRERKISWAEIGKVLGVSRQAVWERFGSNKQASRTETA